MSKLSEILLLHQPEQPIISIKATVTEGRLIDIICHSVEQLRTYLAELNILTMDVPFVAYYEIQKGRVDVEIGYPVPQLVEGRGIIHSRLMPSGKALFCMYQGAYNQIGYVYEEMQAWMKENHYQTLGPFYEYYYSGPPMPVSKHLTKIMLPVVRVEKE